MPNSVPTNEERAARLQLTEHVSNARTVLRPPQHNANGDPLDAPRAPNYRVARLELSAVTGELKDLQKRVYTRLSKLEGDNLAQAQTEWSGWKVNFLLEYDEENHKLESEDPTVLNPSRTKTAETEAATNTAQQAVQQVKDFIKNLDTNLGTLTAQEEGYVMPKHVYLTYQAKIEEAKQMIRPGLPELFEIIIKLDPANSNIVSANLSTALLQCDRDLLDFITKLQHLDLHESTFAPAPRAESTPLDRSVLAQQAASSLVVGASYSSTGSKMNFKQLMDSAPNFDGCPSQYPHWKREMVQDILPGQSDSRGLRLICSKCPHKNLSAMFDTVDEAWNYLDDIYADEQKISDDYTMAFLDRTSVPGATDQEMIMSLYEIVKQLYNTLKAVNRTYELTHQSQMISRIVRLIPIQYREQWEVHKAAKIAASYVETGKMPTQDQYELLIVWLKERTKMLNRCGVNAPAGASAKPPSTRGNTVQSKNNKTDRVPKSQEKRVSAVNVSAVTTSGSVGSGLDINAPSKGRGAQTGPSNNEKEKIAAKWKDWGKCPVCEADGHLFNGKSGWSASNSLANCARWRALPSVDERVDVLLKGKYCTLCASWKHNTENCSKAKNQDGSNNTSWACYIKDAAGTPCGQMHSVHCHGTSRKICSIQVSATSFTDQPGIVDQDVADMKTQDVMLPIIGLELAPGIQTACLLDTGANCSVIATSLAEKLGLKGKKLWQEITVVNKETRLQELTFYVLNLKLHEGERKLLLIGLDSITTSPGAFSIEPAYKLFPHIAPGTLDKPSTPVELLIGTDNADLIGSGGDGPDLVGNLKVFKIPFGPGRVLFGSHPSIKFQNPVPSKAVSFITRATRSPTMPRPPACDNWSEKDYLEDDLQKKWRDLLREMLSAGELLFPRSINHLETKGRPQLIKTKTTRRTITTKAWPVIFSLLAILFMGSQLVSAGKQATDEVGDPPDFNWKEIKSATASQGIVWKQFQKWRHKHRNVEVGDIVLLKYEAALGKPQYRRGRVTEVHPDQHGVVRDATVLTRSCHKGEKQSDFRKKKMTEQRVSVQRLAVLLAADEVANLPKADPALHFCTEDARIPDVSQWSRSPSPSLVPTCPAPPQLVPHSDLAPPGVSSQTSPSATAEKDDEVPRVMEKQAAPADATTGAQHQLAINSLAVSSLSCSPTYLCWECDTRDRVYFVSGEYD